MAKQTLPIYRNTTYNCNFNHIEDMTGGTLYFTIKEDEYDTDATDASALLKKNVTTFTNGGLTATFKLTDADTYIEPGTYYYDIVYANAAGESAPPIFNGKCIIKPHPTNRDV